MTLVELARKVNKSYEETDWLREEISNLAKAKDVNTLYEIMLPLIRKTTKALLKNKQFGWRFLIDDTFQDAYIVFAEMVSDYDITYGCSFLYFSKKYYHYRLRNYIEKHYKFIKQEYHFGLLHKEKDPFNTEDFVLLNNYVEDFYEGVGEILANKHNRKRVGSTEKAIFRYFVEHDNIHSISESSMVSYHAIYQHINKTTYKLQRKLNKSVYGNCLIDIGDIQVNTNHTGVTGTYTIKER